MAKRGRYGAEKRQKELKKKKKREDKLERKRLKKQKSPLNESEEQAEASGDVVESDRETDGSDKHKA